MERNRIDGMELSQEETLVSSDPSTKGFDLSAGKNWIYPLNYQFREYQYNIAKNALFSNTLVCLPTGLGKTLIAAVVMYNFWRWYPRGKIVFLAPTKPLVAQQISACHNIMGIPSADAIELTGSMSPKNRQIAWFTKRVIFATPQVFQNDLEKNIVSGELVRCVVIDEAHKALGKHSYCESLRLLRNQSHCFRVLALSATPGSRIEDVCQVMQNLFISNLELRDETSPDIMPYLNKRQMDIILVPLDDDLARFKEKYVSIMDRYVRLLVQYNVLKGSASGISKGRIFYLYKEFQSKNNRSNNYGQIMKTISRCMSLYHAYELMIRHGLRAFANFCQTHSHDIWMTDEPALQELIKEIQSFLGPFPDIRPLPDGSVEEIPKNLVLGHTKFHKLRKLLLEHFEKFAAKNEETRAIVFVEYRDSVNEVYVSLLQSRPILRPKMFVGQAGQKRKEQMQAMQAFRSNEANVLISTSVGEEGLDVGEVDLIVCFDISQSSPIRLVQRMGRTGRRRDGRIIMLVTDGKEHQALKSTIARKDSLNNKVLHSSNVVSALYQESPRMVPPDLNPVCSKMHIVPQPKTPAMKGKRKRKEKEEDLQKENKKSATVSKIDKAIPAEFQRPATKPTQSSMLQFLKKPTANEDSYKVSARVSELSQANHPSTQVSQPDSIKLLTSDAAAVEFLTLCAVKASKLDEVRDELNRMDETYLAISAHDDMDQFFDYPVPDLNILNCIASLEERMKSSSPEVIEDFEWDQIDDLYVPEFNQHNTVQYSDTNNSREVGKFNYEELLDDSCESDEMALLDDPHNPTTDDNLKRFPQNEEICRSWRNDEPNKSKERLSPKNGDNYQATLTGNNYFDKRNIGERLLGQVSEVEKQQCQEENNYLKIGCFESILEQSSDSDIPSSQSELDSNINSKTRRLSPTNFSISEKQNVVKIEQSAEKPPTSSASNTLSGYQNKIYPLESETSKSSTNNLHRTDSESIQRSTFSLNSSKINKSVDVDKPSFRNDRISSCLSEIPTQSVKGNEDTNTSSRFFTSKRNVHSDIRIGFSSKPKAHDTVVEPVNAVTNNTISSYGGVKKYSEELLDEDDDVIFIEEVNRTTRWNQSGEKSIDEPPNEDNDEVVFEKEVSFGEKTKADESCANSSTCTITQILELLENSTSRKINLGKISKNSQHLSNANKSKQVNPHVETVAEDRSNNADASISYYFNRENHQLNNCSFNLKTEEPSQAELDLSDIKWEDDFETEKKDTDRNEVRTQLDEKLNSDFEVNLLVKKQESFKTNSESSTIILESNTQIEKSTSNKRETSPLTKKEESFKTNSNCSDNFSTTDMQAEKSSPQKVSDFDLGDYEWDSDFETPANPVESLKRFSKPDNTSSLFKSKDASTSGSASRQLSSKFREPDELSSFVAPMKKKLSTKKGEMFKPSTSQNCFHDDSDSEENFFQKLDKKCNIVKDNHPKTNYVLTTSRNPMISKEIKLFKREKENAEPNSGLLKLSSFSASQKDKDIRKVPFSRGVTTADRKKVSSLDRYPSKRKRHQNRNRVKSEFLDYEAEVSCNTSSGTSGEDDDLDGFVSHSQEGTEIVDMQRHYLQSIKDVHGTGAFHFKKPTAFIPDDEVFSQPMSQIEESAYINDSFCVSGGENDFFTESHEESLLELAERALKSKKRKNSTNGRASAAKRIKVAEISLDSHSSEDETEKLRKQILDESLNLKKKKK